MLKEILSKEYSQVREIYMELSPSEALRFVGGERYFKKPKTVVLGDDSFLLL